MELSLRNRIATVKDVRKRPFPERVIEVIDDKSTGEVILDEALKLIKVDKQSVANWIDLLSGETWNLMKVGYQLKQVRERIAKGLVDKGVLRTEKRNFVLFDMATHPIANQVIKEQLIQKVVDTLLGRGPAPDPRTIATVCAAYAANVLENALVGLPHAQREAAFAKVDEFLLEHSALGDKAKACGTSDIVAGVLVVYTKVFRFINHRWILFSNSIYSMKKSSFSLGFVPSGSCLLPIKSLFNILNPSILPASIASFILCLIFSCSLRAYGVSLVAKREMYFKSFGKWLI